MCTLLIVFLLVFNLFSASDSVKIKFDPNQFRITSEPNEINKLFEILLRTKNFDLLMRILRTEASDFITSYCSIWKSADNSDLIYTVWDGYYAGLFDKEILKELILPECIAKSYFTIMSLTKQMIQALPNSLLQAKDFPFHLLATSMLDHIIQKAAHDQSRDPRIDWSSWISTKDLDFHKCPDTSIHYKYSWQFINPQEYKNISESKWSCLIKWLLLGSDSEFMKLSDEEALIRTLTLISWKSHLSASALCSIIRKIDQRALKSSCVSLIEEILKLGGPNDPDWNLNILMRVIASLNHTNILIGDWFIGILGLWRNVLKALKPVEKDLRIFDKILQFTLFTVNPTYEGVTKLPQLFDPSMRSFIEKQVFEKFKGEIKYFYREHPSFFEHNFNLIPLEIRLKSFLRSKRTVSFIYGSLNEEYDMTAFRKLGPRDFLLFIGDKLKHGVSDLSKTSLNASPFNYAGKVLSFKSLTKLFLLSIAQIPDWFKVKRIDGKDYVIPMPYCPDLFWELLGYFLIQARVLNIKIDFVLEKEFFVEMMNPTGSENYIKSLSEPFKEQKLSEVKVLSSNIMERFTVVSIENTSPDHFLNQNILTDCYGVVFKLFQKGMKCMRQGIAYLIEPAKFTSEELYNFIFN